ncbi:PREDICTED: PIH1 domain-containing protein 1 [Polistes dominula]|uniref:PIH1 domain-containing protein 1 n=1 Tax=Polistes dominula TaxID=743375 RepID=A0ABM1IU26_POLDO|nr:PREDICTED: PIH1 domain-containing protein 1 [Polistes dominula]
MSDKTLLDIDDTILRKNLLLSENKHESEIDEILKQQFETKPKSIIIHPSPGVCIKTKTNAGEKVFLNVCTTNKIPPPEDISEETLISLLDQETPFYSIPMSIGQERLEPDKGGTLCMTHDVAINKNFFEKCQTQNYLWLFTMTVIIEGVSHKFAKSLDSKTCIVLKNRKVMGTIQPQRIDDREARPQSTLAPQSKKPLIQEISSNTLNTDKSVTLAQLQNNCQKPETNNYVILKEPLEGIAKRLIGLFLIPKGISTHDLDVLVDVDRIIVTTTSGNKFAYDICMPYAINLNETESFFDQDLRILRLNMPIENM